mmetsp:Transcript_1853/g.2814  ORF Transcript_1853/g.2814 Transcript_1853/m.2814 type:complete len:80 (+) Transcript_1853:53-292(+)|eukprot:CAMPEP_0195510018 /NCGR_PEP_ID=MMETSP0794_2-20130614/2786_1 /TAXON_ID=515487 /ORGANISM="Stephanopyxis turris, Strain CCMP 815" /LENGTH=79 /DNA_ID=CAMNT_0040637365 /DNA_START=79 /DNA_END=318 /DNA_ORIENTATION=-
MFKSVALLSLVASASAFAPSPRVFGVQQTALSAEPEWAAPADWKDTNWEKDLEKLQAEAEDRLDKKISELMANVDSAGK